MWKYLNYMSDTWNILTTCFGLHGHLQVGCENWNKTKYNTQWHRTYINCGGGTRSRLHRRGHAEYINIRCCIWKRPGGWPVGMRRLVWFIVLAGVWCTGQPGRPCGRHELSLSEVQWLGVDRPQILNGLECQTSLMKLMIIEKLM